MICSTIVFKNNGADITETDFWASGCNRVGLFLVTINKHAFRIMIPYGCEYIIDELGDVKHVIVTKGLLNRVQSFEFLFEDESEKPFAIFMDHARVLPCPPDRENGRTGLFCSLWLPTSHISPGMEVPRKAVEFPAMFRVSDYLPCLEPWEIKSN